MPAATRKAGPVGAKKQATKSSSAAGRPAKSAKKAVAKKPVAKAASATKKTVAKKPGSKPTPAAKQVVAKKVVAKKASTTTRVVKASTAKVAPVKAAPVVPRKTTVTCSLSGFEVTPGSPQLAPKTVERLREKLLEEKQRLLRQSEELAAEADQLVREREAGDTQFDEESGEGDTVNIERERDLLLSASARQVVEEIDEALIRMKKGTYGVCRYAGRKISVERLEAIPWANVCVDCKARAERRR